MNCEQAETLLAAYVFGEAPAPEAEALREHLALCDTCSRAVRDMRAASLLLGEAFAAAESPKLSEDRQAKLAQLRRQEPAKASARTSWTKAVRWRYPLAAAAGVALVLAVFAGSMGPPGIKAQHSLERMSLPAADVDRPDGRRAERRVEYGDGLDGKAYDLAAGDEMRRYNPGTEGLKRPVDPGSGRRPSEWSNWGDVVARNARDGKGRTYSPRLGGRRTGTETSGKWPRQSGSQGMGRGQGAPRGPGKPKPLLPSPEPEVADLAFAASLREAIHIYKDGPATTREDLGKLVKRLEKMDQDVAAKRRALDKYAGKPDDMPQKVVPGGLPDRSAAAAANELATLRGQLEAALKEPTGPDPKAEELREKIKSAQARLAREAENHKASTVTKGSFSSVTDDELRKDLVAKKAELEAKLNLAMGVRKKLEQEKDRLEANCRSRTTLYAAASKHLDEARDAQKLVQNGKFDDALKLLSEAQKFWQQHAADFEKGVQTLDYVNKLAAVAQDGERKADEKAQKQAAALAANVRVNPYVMTADDNQWTFALETDTGSYAVTRNYILRRGQLPPARMVRVEEFVNAFDYNLSGTQSNAFSIHNTLAPSPFRPGLYQLNVGVKAKRAGRDGRRANNLVLCFDTSSSMGTPDRLPFAQKAATALVDKLDLVDSVSIVTYGTTARLALDRTLVKDHRAKIKQTIAALQANGSTNIATGLGVAYQQMQKSFRSGAYNSVIHISDGVANVGAQDAKDILRNVSRDRAQGIALNTFGVGSGEYNDRMMEQLANNGDGVYGYIDSEEQAKRVFVDGFAALQIVAKDAKVQIEFDPSAVRRYRPLGYENRDVADKDFRNDAVNAGEIGSGQTATALCEVELLKKSGPVATVRVRYRDVESGRVQEFASLVTAEDICRSVAKTSPRYRLAACAAQFAEILRSSPYAGDAGLKQVEQMLTEVCSELPLDSRAAELLTLVHKAQGLPRATE
jgi:Ca-activated chloride channel homolog